MNSKREAPSNQINIKKISFDLISCFFSLKIIFFTKKKKKEIEQKNKQHTNETIELKVGRQQFDLLLFINILHLEIFILFYIRL